MTMTLIETKTLGTAAAQIEFTSIPQDGTDLYITVSARTNAGNDLDTLLVKFNGVTTNQTSRMLRGTGSAVSSSSLTEISFAVVGNTATSNTFGNAAFYVPNYSGATNKSVSMDIVIEQNTTTAYQQLFAALWSSTAAITSFTVAGQGTNLLTGSTVSLYKITKGSDGIVTVS